ncbi:MAG: hypothetical protein H0T13_00875 [Actinobacteria bacterium]|nr:hypothetical protein [Actinomycetota bacterium]
MVDPSVSGSRASTAEVESARREWEDGYQRLQTSRDADVADRLLAQVEVVTDELRRRVGGTFTLGELTRVYGRADSWSRAAVAEHAPSPGWARTLSTVEAAAFYVYARGAVDYEP